MVFLIFFFFFLFAKIFIPKNKNKQYSVKTKKINGLSLHIRIKRKVMKLFFNSILFYAKKARILIIFYYKLVHRHVYIICSINIKSKKYKF